MSFSESPNRFKGNLSRIISRFFASIAFIIDAVIAAGAMTLTWTLNCPHSCAAVRVSERMASLAAA